MANETTKNISAYKLLASPQNIAILRALKERPSKAKDLENKVGLDRMSIKRRLYKLVAVGFVKENKEKSGKATAIIYHVVNKKIPSTDLFSVLGKVESNELLNLTKV